MPDYLGQLIARSFDRGEALRPRPVALFEPSQPAHELPLPPDDARDEEATPPPTAPLPRRRTPEPLHSPDAVPPSVEVPPSFQQVPGVSPSPPEVPLSFAWPLTAPRSADEPPTAESPRTSPPPAAPPPAAPPPAAPLLPPEPQKIIVEKNTELVRPEPLLSPAASSQDEPVQRQPASEVLVERVVETTPPPTVPSARPQTLLPPEPQEVVIERNTRKVRQESSPREAPPPPRRLADLHGARRDAEVQRIPAAPPSPSEKAAPVIVRPRLEPAPRETAAPTPPPPAPAPTIHVTIGRVEVKASPSPATPPRRPRPQPSIMSLDEYLRQRTGGGHR